MIKINQAGGTLIMKKVLVLSGSPRIQGNSSILCDEFIRGAQEAGNVVEKIYVTKKKVGGCLGCNACYRNGGICVQKDDMSEIQEKMLDADVIVLSSPIYFYSMTSQMKAVIDRTYSFYQGLSGKTFYFIITCAAPEEGFTDTMIDSLRGFTKCVPDSVEGGIIMGLGNNDPGDVKNTSAMENAYEMGRQI